MLIKIGQLAILYRGDMYSEWLAYGNDAKKITEAFTAGINAYR